MPREVCSKQIARIIALVDYVHSERYATPVLGLPETPVREIGNYLRKPKG